MRILVFGDSISHGARDAEKGGWVERLKASVFGMETDNSVYNLSVSGHTTEDLINRFKDDIKSRATEPFKKENTIIFAIGINDSAFLEKEKRNWIIKEKSKENLIRLIEMAKQIVDKIFIVNILPVEEAKVTPIPWETNIFYRNRNIKEYNEMIKYICEENNIPLIDVYNKWAVLDYNKLLADGLHPNSEGHKIIFEIVKQVLVENKVI